MSTSGRKHHKTSVQNIPAGGHIVHRNSSGFGHVILSRVVCCQLSSSVCRRAARNPADVALRSANDRTTMISPSSTHSAKHAQTSCHIVTTLAVGPSQPVDLHPSVPGWEVILPATVSRVLVSFRDGRLRVATPQCIQANPDHS